MRPTKNNLAKAKLIICFTVYTFCFSSNLFAQQSIVKGVVSIFNSKRSTGQKKYVESAVVRDLYGRSNPTLTHSDGTFSLVYINIKDNTPVTFDVSKKGLSVVNFADLKALTGQHLLVEISMADPDSITEYRVKLYRIGKTNLEKGLTKQIKQKGDSLVLLKQNSILDGKAIQELEYRIYSLEKNFRLIDAMAQDFANVFSTINLDDTKNDISNAIWLAVNGFQDSAIQTLLELNLEDKLKHNSSLRESLRKKDSVLRSEAVSEILGIKALAELYKNSFQSEKAVYYYGLLIKYDSLNVENFIEYSMLLKLQNKFSEAQYFGNRALTLCREPYWRLIALNNLGLIEMHLMKFKEAKNIFENIVHVRDSLGNSFPENVYFAIGQGFSNFSVLNFNNRNYGDAELFGKEAYNIFSDLAKDDVILYNHYKAGVLSNLGSLYAETNRFDSASLYFRKAIKIFRDSTGIGSTEFAPELARVLGSFGLSFSSQDEFDSARVYYQLSFDMYKKLVEIEPKIYLPDLARLYKYFGGLNKSLNEIQESKIHFGKALEIYRELSLDYPLSYMKDIHECLSDLALLYDYNFDFDSAKTFILKAIAIDSLLEARFPNQYQFELGSSFSILANIYMNAQQIQEAVIPSNRAVMIMKALSTSNKRRYLPDFAASLQARGRLQLMLGNNQNAVNDVKQALSIFDSLSKVSRNIYTFEIVQCLRFLALCYENLGQPKLAEQSLKQADQLAQALAKSRSFAHLLLSGEVHAALGTFYRTYAYVGSSEKEYLEAIKIMEDLLTKSPERVGVELGTARIDLGILYQITHRHDKAKRQFEFALLVYRDLSKTAPQRYSEIINKLNLEIVNEELSNKQNRK